MPMPVHLVGIGAEGREGLNPKSRQILESATFLAGGRRHLAMVAAEGIETFAITNNLAELAERLEARTDDERCVVLASGDPLCFGVGAYLRHRLGPESLVVHPHVSSLQLAFARVVQPWADAVLATVHGRPLASTLLPLLGLPKIGLLTQDGTSPAAVAEFFLSHGLDEYDVWVCEKLGADDEQVSQYPLRELIGRRFDDLNVLVLVRNPTPGAGRISSGRCGGAIVPPDGEFDQPESGPILLTHGDVRSVVLNRFHDIPDGPIWDLGAGLGGVAISLARQFERVEVVAVERSPVQLEFLRRNRRRFEAWNLRVVEGVAPDALLSEPSPAGIFMGGSGGRLDAILDLVLERLSPRGVFVADFVGLENLSRTLERLKQARWAPDVAQVQISPGRDLAGLTTFTPLRPVWVVRAMKPGF